MKDLISKEETSRTLTISEDVLVLKGRFGLTVRQAELIQHMSHGAYEAKEIAEIMGIEPSTARTHIQTILNLVDVTSKTGILALLLRINREALEASQISLLKAE